MAETTDKHEAPTLERRGNDAENAYRRSIFSMQVTVCVVIGAVRIKIADMLKLDKGDILPLTCKIEDPIELRVDDRLIARGELVEEPEGSTVLGVKITEIVDINEVSDA